ncbi:creatinase-like [Palaemon carinicauda]|uniref:creatinase-like n=1 Tax=Palaemon carinicauda TaxID=392227 RepID=UPI0035B60DCA
MFSAGEIDGRITRLRNYMEEEKLVACLFTSIHNINYYTGGFVYYAFGRRYGLLVTPEKHVTISSLVDFGQPWRRSPYDNIVYTDWEKDNYFKAVVEELGDTGGAIGIESDHMTLETSQKLKDHLPKSNELKDISYATMSMRMIKSKEEIGVIKKISTIADAGGWACVDAMDENVPEYEVAHEATHAMVKRIPSEFPHSDLRDAWVWVQSGIINSDGAHNSLTSRRIQKGDIVVINCFPMPQGYYSALERTLFFDHCNDDQLKIWEANVAVHMKGLELVKPGVKCSDVANELNELLAQSDLLKYRTFGYGHSFGVLCHYYGREAGLELREDVHTVLQPGMVLSMELMLMIPEGQPGAGGYREHDVLVINDGGSVDNITGFLLGPEHNIIKK